MCQQNRNSWPKEFPHISLASGGVCRHIEKLEPSWRKELVFPLQLGYCPPACIMVLATNFYDRCFAFAIPYYAALICVHSTLCRLHHY